MALLDIVGLTKRLDEGQRELNDRLDRVIVLLAALLDAASGVERRPLKKAVGSSRGQDRLVSVAGDSV